MREMHSYQHYSQSRVCPPQRPNTTGYEPTTKQNRSRAQCRLRCASGFGVRGFGVRRRVQISGFEVPNPPCHGVQGSGFRVQGVGLRAPGSGFRVQGSGFRIQGSGCRVEGAGFRLEGSESTLRRPARRLLHDSQKCAAVPWRARI